MRFSQISSRLMLLGLLLGAVSPCPAQQVTVGTPYHSLNDSFFERTGVNFGFNFGGPRGGGFMVFGRPLPAGFGDPAGGNAALRNTLDVDGGRSLVAGMQAPGVFTPDLGIPFRQNGFGLAVPQFGGFDPSAGLSSGFQIRGRGFNGSLNWTASQGYRQSFVSQTPSVTLMNGQTGFISDTSQSPFVIGFIPVVGGFPTLPPPYRIMAYPGYSMAPALRPVAAGNHRVQAFRRQMAGQPQAGGRQAALHRAAKAAVKPPQRAAPAEVDPLEPVPAVPRDRSAGKLAAAQSSSAARAVPGVAEARRLHQLEQATRNNEALALFERGRTAEEGGKPNVAKIYYRMAAKQAQGELRDQIRARLDALSSKKRGHH